MDTEGHCFYVDYRDAHRQLLERRENFDLRKKVDNFFLQASCGIPQLPDIPFALLARQIATARYEDIVFQLIARVAGLDPVWSPYHGDVFSSQSAYKKTLIDPFIIEGRGNKGGPKRHKDSGLIVNSIEGCNHKPIGSIMTKSGISLVSYHMQRRDYILPNTICTPDMTRWFKSLGNAKQYYPYYLAMAIYHCVIVDDFHQWSDDAEKVFAEEVFEPAFNLVTEKFGVSPLIIQLPWWNELAWYPADANWCNHKIIQLNADGFPEPWKPLLQPIGIEQQICQTV